MNAPSVPAWPAQVLPDEPVHGFFQRLAAINGHVSCRTFAAFLGLNGRNYDFDELLTYCSVLPTRGAEELLTSTPKRSAGSVTLRGEVFNPSQWAFNTVRICPACVSESRHHRNWFDLAFVECCPFHDQLLIDGSAQEKLARWYPSVGVLPHSGQDLAGAAPAAGHQETLARYVLGRLGCAPRWGISYLDAYSCAEVIQMSELLGRMREFGWAERSSLKASWTAARRRWTEVGFTIIRDGPSSMMAELSLFTAGSSLKPSSTEVTFAISQFYGWLHRRVCELKGSSFGSDFRSMMTTHAELCGVFSRKEKRTQGRAGTDTLNSLARKLGVTDKTARELMRKANLLRSTSHKGRPHSITIFDQLKIIGLWTDLVSRQEAEIIIYKLGLGELAGHEKAGRIERFIRVGGRTKAHDRFLRSSLAIGSCGIRRCNTSNSTTPRGAPDSGL